MTTRIKSRRQKEREKISSSFMAIMCLLRLPQEREEREREREKKFAPRRWVVPVLHTKLEKKKSVIVMMVVS